MARQIALELASSLAPMEALRLVADRLGLEWGYTDWVRGPALEISAIKPSRYMNRSLIEEEYHFTDTLMVGFRFINNDDRYWDGWRTIMRATCLLFEHSGDGVLLFNGEKTVLQRLGGARDLELNEGYKIWGAPEFPERALTIPYVIKPLRSPLLEPDPEPRT